MKKSRHTIKILLAEAIFLVGIFVYVFISTSPSQIYPLSGMNIIDNDFEFEIKNSEEVLISLDEEFTKPIVLKENSDITLPPGLYFWKVRRGLRESEVRNFTISGHVAMEIREEDEKYFLDNTGNVILNVTKTTGNSSKTITIYVDESEEIENDDSIYRGEQA